MRQHISVLNLNFPCTYCACQMAASASDKKHMNSGISFAWIDTNLIGITYEVSTVKDNRS